MKAGLQYSPSQATDDGHCYLPTPTPQLTGEATKILDVPADLAVTVVAGV